MTVRRRRWADGREPVRRGDGVSESRNSGNRIRRIREIGNRNSLGFHLEEEGPLATSPPFAPDKFPGGGGRKVGGGRSYRGILNESRYRGGSTYEIGRTKFGRVKIWTFSSNFGNRWRGWIYRGTLPSKRRGVWGEKGGVGGKLFEILENVRGFCSIFYINFVTTNFEPLTFHAPPPVEPGEEEL